jgi:thiol-disulfide isomerase/thioredoxin
LLVTCASAIAEDVASPAIPHLGAKGLAGYEDYAASAGHKAFVIAPGGTWAWSAEQPTADMALEAAVDECSGYTEQTCVPYALDETTVFDAKRWAGLWGPYLKAADADKAKIGTRRGERFPDLRLLGKDGKASSLATLRGRVVLLHLWGSWCPSCARELPDLVKLRQRLLVDKLAVETVLVPVREDVDLARAWLQEQQLDLPLFDGGASSLGEETLQLADGSTLPDRTLAQVFPSTYVLDRHGVVVFAITGAAQAWEEYLPLLQDVANRSGQ